MSADDARGEVLHRDLGRGLIAGVLSAIVATVLAVVLFVDHEAVITGGGCWFFAVGWGLGAGVAWTVGAALARRAGLVVGVLALALVAPLAGLGGEFQAAFFELRAVDAATKLVIEGERAPSGRDLLVRMLAGGLVLGPLLVARRRRLGLTWELAGPLAGALLLAVALGLLHVRGGARDLGLDSVAAGAVVLQVACVVVTFALTLRLVDLDLPVAGSSRRKARRPGGGVALGAVAFAWLAVAAEPGESAGTAAARLLPWPRDGEGLVALGHYLRMPPMIVVRARGGTAVRGPRPLGPLGPLAPPFLAAPPNHEASELRERQALAAYRRAGELGDVEGMREAARILLHRNERVLSVAATARRFVQEGPAPAEGLAWLRRAAARGDVHDALELDRRLGSSEPEQAEAIEVLLRAGTSARDDPEPMLAAAKRLDARTEPEVRRRILAGLSRIAWAPEDGDPIGDTFAEDGSRPRRWTFAPTPPAHRALQLLVRHAPIAELGAVELLAVAVDDAEAVVRIRQRRLDAGCFGLADDTWTRRFARWPIRGGDARAPLPASPLLAWPAGAGELPAIRDALRAAAASLRAGRPLDAWTTLDRAHHLAPRSRALTVARALTYLVVAAPPGAGGLLDVHLDIANDLAAPALELAPPCAELLAAHATLDLWRALIRGDRDVSLALGRLKLAARLSPADLRLPVRAAALSSLASSVYRGPLASDLPTAASDLGAWFGRLGRERLDAQDLAGAERLLLAAITFWPDDPWALSNLHSVAFARGDVSLAKRALDRLHAGRAVQRRD